MAEKFDKYKLYFQSVQSPDFEVSFIKKQYKILRNAEPLILREDFCAAFSICCEWTKLGPKNVAIGVDIDSEPINYGIKNYLSQLKPAQQERVQIEKKNVLTDVLPKADAVCAFNFSYFIFKERLELLKYFKNVKKSLRKNGVFFMDCFGGYDCYQPIEESQTFTKQGFTYFWEQTNFNPVNNEALFHIHFQRKNERKRNKVFTYDWRIWNLQELQDLLKEAGFKETVVFWEGSTRTGEGNGIFRPTKKGEACASWVSYIAALN